MGAPDWIDVCPIKNVDIPASYVSLPEGNSWEKNSHHLDVPLEVSKRLGSVGYNPNIPHL